METASDDELSASAEKVCDLVGSLCERGHKGYAHEIRLEVRIERFYVLVAEENFVFGRRQGGDDLKGEETEAEHGPVGYVRFFRGHPKVIGGGKNEKDFHGLLLCDQRSETECHSAKRQKREEWENGVSCPPLRDTSREDYLFGLGAYGAEKLGIAL